MTGTVVRCEHCGRRSARDATMLPRMAPGLRVEYECADYQACADRMAANRTLVRDRGGRQPSRLATT